MAAEGTVLNRRQLEDAQKLQALEAQEQALLKQLGEGSNLGNLADEDLSSLELDEHAESAANNANNEEDEAAAAAAAEAAAKEAERAKAAADEKARKAAEEAAAKKAAQAKAEVKPEKPAPGTTEFWKREAETWKRRKGDSDRHLTPVQEEASRLRKELDELKTRQNDDRLAALQKEIEGLRSLVASPRAAQSEMVEDEAIQTELMALKSVNPEAARLVEIESRRIQKTVEQTRAQLREEVQKELEDVRKAKAALEARKAELEQETLLERHRAFVLKEHPDVDDIYTYAIDSLREWASMESPEYLNIVQNPLSVSGKMFSKVLTEFKTHAVGESEADGSGAGDTPAAGDLTTMVRRATVPARPAAKEDGLLTDYELDNFERIMQDNWRNPEKQASLLARLEKTIAANPETQTP